MTINIARDYLKRGWAPLPIPRGAKAPTLKDWGKLTITTENLSEYFNGGPMNVGVLLGPRSAGLCDVDLDCREAIELASAFLPKTGAVFGRQSKRRSHHLFYVRDAKKASSIRWQDDKDDTILELRLGVSGAAQTVFPGSQHASGEVIEWAEDGAPAEVGFTELDRAVRKIAVATLLIRHWPSKGRHEAALRLGGVFARAGWDVAEAAELVEAVAVSAGDEERADRVRAVEDSYESHRTGRNTWGLPALKEHLGDAVSDRIAKLLEYREVDTDATLERMNERYCVVPYNGKVRVMAFERELDRELPTFYSAADFKLLHDNKKITVGDKKRVGLGTWWINHPLRHQHEGVIFAPGAPRIVDGRLLNLWRGWGIEPQSGKWPLLRRHIEVTLAAGNPDYAAYIIYWTAWTFQNPGTPPEVAIVFPGGRGTGKGLFGRGVRRIFGQHGLQISSSDHLTGNFNRHLLDCAFLFADEAFWPGDKSAEGTLKRVITEDTLFIVPKGIDGKWEINRLHIMMATNAEWVVPAGHDERRFAIFKVSEKHKQERTYFDPLYQEMENGGLGAMLHDMLAMDLGRFHPRYDVPKTAALAEQKERSLSASEQWWINLLRSGELPYVGQNRPTEKRLSMSSWVFEHMRKTAPKLKDWSEHLLSDELKKFGCDRSHNWRVEGRRAWRFPPLREARADWDRRMGTVTEWDDAEEWGYVAF
jgi:hypothetical protein